MTALDRRALLRLTAAAAIGAAVVLPAAKAAASADPVIAVIAARAAIMRQIEAVDDGALSEEEYNEALAPFWGELGRCEDAIAAAVPNSLAGAVALLRHQQDFLGEGWAEGEYTDSIQRNVIACLQRLSETT